MEQWNQQAGELIAQKTCQQFDLPAPRQIDLSTNLLFRVGEDLCLKVFRPGYISLKAVNLQRRVSEFLNDHNVPSLIPEREEAFEIDGVVCSFCRFEQGDRHKGIDGAEWGSLLKDFHQALDSFPEPIPHWQPTRRFLSRLGQAATHPLIEKEDIAALAFHFSSLVDQLLEIKPLLKVGPVHGDLGRPNILWSDARGWLIIDLDEIRVAPREWDLAIPSRSEHEIDYPAFVENYGFDVKSWTGLETINWIHHLGGLIWCLGYDQLQPGLVKKNLAKRREALNWWRGEGQALLLAGAPLPFSRP